MAEVKTEKHAAAASMHDNRVRNSAGGTPARRTHYPSFALIWADTLAISARPASFGLSAAMQATGAKAMADMGKVMAALKPKLAGRADMAKVSAQIKAKLG